MPNLERAENLQNCRICQYESYKSCSWRNLPYFTHEWINEIPKGEMASVSDLKNTENPDENCYLACELMEGSDYSNGRIVQESNQKVFLEEFAEFPGVHETYGGHNSFGIAVQIKHLTDEMFEMFKALEDYSVLDESLMSEMELEQQGEAWKSWVESDFKKELDRHLGIEIEEAGNNFYALFHYCAEYANEYWFEDGCSQYIQVDKIAEVCTEKLLTEYGVKYENVL